jgi:hypothetical protein
MTIRGLTFRMAQTPVQHYLPQLLEKQAIAIGFEARKKGKNAPKKNKS